ncbi:MAG TPA: VOC family protein [Roseiflexaceae bacterium]|nr:VOC family protein [Roseiflexaceae bacterium]
MFQGIIELMYFVEDREAAARWYADLFGAPVATLDTAPGALFIRVGGQEVWFHQADRKVPAGAAGQVAYWRVDDFDAALARAENGGGALYRGPLDRLDGFWMCQVRDPFGNLIGLVGPRQEKEEPNA